MGRNEITVVYKWTANPGQLDALKGIYDGVTDAMQTHEPGALGVQVYVSEAENALYVRDVFADADALGFHLSETAGPHFPNLLEIATPGAFLFFGTVPAQMQQAAKAMGLAAEFADHRVGFNR
ncbi:putative quinol monooxygenase [Roseobacteraceae bacterium S113]